VDIDGRLELSDMPEVFPNSVLVYRNQNEDGEYYGEHDNLGDALQFFAQYPNDAIVITLRAKR
jgi:hypothetical protein